MLNRNREVKPRPHQVLEALADWQACANARRHAVEEFDGLGQDFGARCLATGLIGKTIANVTADESYFRTTHAYGGALIFDAMIEGRSRSGMTSWECAASRGTTGRSTGASTSAGMNGWTASQPATGASPGVVLREHRGWPPPCAWPDPPRRRGRSPGMPRRTSRAVTDATSALGPPGTRPARMSCGTA